jgi:hypothetical protein
LVFCIAGGGGAGRDLFPAVAVGDIVPAVPICDSTATAWFAVMTPIHLKVEGNSGSGVVYVKVDTDDGTRGDLWTEDA